jgi:hypothetical protein
MIRQYLSNEIGAARSSLVFAAAMAVTTVAMLAAFAQQDAQQASTLNDLSGTQYLSSQKLQ